MVATFDWALLQKTGIKTETSFETFFLRRFYNYADSN